ncbi:unnamed protein product [Phytophthora fragariaefolia]|uniref:Unnamed protein product n=1 Tax=Phytophthora fragariaefolia TaxID=1490495 RepID=A0A9W7DDS3_9STRA|nr:unnamed protein product [Phytophthora fragariaefolia]
MFNGISLNFIHASRYEPNNYHSRTLNFIHTSKVSSSAAAATTATSQTNATTPIGTRASTAPPRTTTTTTNTIAATTTTASIGAFVLGSCKYHDSPGNKDDYHATATTTATEVGWLFYWFAVSLPI